MRKVMSVFKSNSLASNAISSQVNLMGGSLYKYRGGLLGNAFSGILMINKRSSMRIQIARLCINLEDMLNVTCSESTCRDLAIIDMALLNRMLLCSDSEYISRSGTA